MHMVALHLFDAALVHERTVIVQSIARGYRSGQSDFQLQGCEVSLETQYKLLEPKIKRRQREFLLEVSNIQMFDTSRTKGKR